MNRGSSSDGKRPSASERRFNEAPIHESGKSPRYSKIIGEAALASMRPRFMNRGSPIMYVFGIRGMPLQ